DYLKLNGTTVGDKVGFNGMHNSVTAGTTAAPQTSEPMSYSLRDAREGAPTCSECGMLMVPNGGCYKCENCGSTSGCS
ncbi:MAG: hypothetical protein WCD68_08780, partial [Candidatus Acidiferrum sp.]